MNRNVVNIADFDSLDPDEEFICPYDPVHKVIAKRFPYHVMKCRKNWNGKAKLTCIFNARHIVSASEHRHHIANCPDKKCIEADVSYRQRKAGLHQSGMNTKGCTELPTYDRLPSPTEDWDDECSAESTTSYFHEDNRNPAVFQNLTGYSPAERRQFHQDIGTVHFKKQDDVDATKPTASTDSNETGDIYRPQARRADDAHHLHAQPQSTASVPGEHKPLGAASGQQMRLPRQPAKAAGMAANGYVSSQSSPSKKGGRIAANIFSTGEPHVLETTPGAAFVPQPVVSTPFATTENIGGQPSSAFHRPPVGLGRGAVPGLGRGMVPGLGRGMVPGLGRGLAKSDTGMTQREYQN